MADITQIAANGINYNIKDATARSDIATANGNISSLADDMETADGNITLLGTRMTTAEGDIDTLEGKMTTAEGNITSLQGQVNNLITGGTGYVKLPDGTMLEWGSGTASHSSSGVVTQTVNFSQAFISAPVVVIGLAAGEPEYENCSANPSAASFVASTYSSYDGGNTVRFAWLAIGRWQ